MPDDMPTPPPPVKDDDWQSLGDVVARVLQKLLEQRERGQ